MTALAVCVVSALARSATVQAKVRSQLTGYTPRRFREKVGDALEGTLLASDSTTLAD